MSTRVDILSLFDIAPTVPEPTAGELLGCADTTPGADTFTPRPYQSVLRDAVLDSWQQRRSVMVQLPTGGGKTVLAGDILHREPDHLAHSWLTHRDHLRAQSARSLERWGLSTWDMSKAQARSRRWLRGTVNITSTGLRTLPPIDADTAGVMVVDEAHHAPAGKTWAPKIRNWPGRVLGITATPWRLSPYQGFTDLFDVLICGPSMQELTDLEPEPALATAEVLYPDGFRMDRDNLETRGGEITAKSAQSEQERLLRLVNVAEWHNTAVGRGGINPDTARTIWFCASVSAAHHLARVLNEAGEPAEAVDADTPTHERTRIIGDLAAGRIRHVTNYEIFTEGADVPVIDVAVMLRPTLSLALHLQMIGRAIRPPGPVLILDAVGNTKTHGLHTEPHAWHLEPRAERDGDEAGEPWTAECPWPGCGGMHPTATRFCKWCEQPTGKECVGCRLWRRLNHFAGNPPTLDEQECGECEAKRNAATFTTGSHKERRLQLIDSLTVGDTVGEWYLSTNGNPTIRRRTANGDEWTVVTKTGMVIRKLPDSRSDKWQPLGPLTERLIEHA